MHHGEARQGERTICQRSARDARDLGEAALGKLPEVQEAEADQLTKKATKLDEAALKETVWDLEQDAGSDPNAAKNLPG
jgi:hypothetical protein